MIRNLGNYKRLVVVAYRLPFTFKKYNDTYKAIQNSGGLVSAMLALSQNLNHAGTAIQNKKIVWAGTAEKLPKNLPPDVLSNDSFYMVPVDIPSQINEKFYGGFCNDLIWPLFHYFSSYCIFEREYFEAYKEANSIFCDELVKHLMPGDFIWIHDYQLMFLPAMVREKFPGAAIGFFLHIPFPSYEIFRLLPRPWRETLLKGILGADIIGFHTHDYSQHFIKSVKRNTSFECRQNLIYTTDRVVKVDAFPIGIDYKKFNDASQDKQILKEKLQVRKSISYQKLIFSVDRLDYTKGLLSRLEGFKLFLEKYPDWRRKVVFNMVVVPSRDSIDKYKEMKREIEYLVGHINGTYSTLDWRPIIYQYKSLSFIELVALYDISDVGLITPLRDGMNLVAKEYVASQVDNKGVLILSEMAGAAAELNEALIINPADISEIADAINTALNMENAEKEERLKRMQNRIASYNVFEWAVDFLSNSIEIKNHQEFMGVKLISNEVTELLSNKYKESSQRILFLDYDGTLVEFARYPERALIDKDTSDFIKSLTNDPKNHVVIISGRGRDFLESQFRNIPVTLIAEHGYFIRDSEGKWQARISASSDWKDTVRPILQDYVNRCNGSFIEEKTGSIAWHYRNADTDFAMLRVNELRDDLAEIIRYKTDFEILEGNKVLEVKSGKYDKGQAAASILNASAHDFILAAGDDNTDEFLFKALPDESITIRVGLKPSFARYNVIDIVSLIQFLKEISS